MVARNFNESEMHFLPDPESGGKEAGPTASGVCINNLYGKLSGNKLTKSSKKGIIIKWDIYDIRKSKRNKNRLSARSGYGYPHKCPQIHEM